MADLQAIWQEAAARIAHRGPFLVAISGGADSTLLAYLMVQTFGLETVHLANFNHRWGPFGEDAAIATQKCAQTLGTTFYQGEGQGKEATNAEETARIERYTWLATTAKALGCKSIVTGHNQTDRVENLLMRLGKGSGLTGLTGLREESHWQGTPILRPLLGLSGADIRTWAREKGLTWLEDPSNPHTARGRVRALLPILESAGIPQHALAASLAALTQAETALENTTETLWHTFLNLPHTLAIKPEKNAENPTIFANAETLTNAPEELAQRLLTRALQTCSGEIMAPRRSKKLALLRQIQENPTGTATLGGCLIKWKKKT